MRSDAGTRSDALSQESLPTPTVPLRHAEEERGVLHCTDQCRGCADYLEARAYVTLVSPTPLCHSCVTHALCVNQARVSICPAARRR